MELFPLTIATGNAFCNREEQRKKLLSNIEKGRHTLIVGPRRYGKSSLVAQTVEDLSHSKKKNVLCAIDFSLLAFSSSAIEAIANAAGKALGHMAPASKKTLSWLSQRILEMNPRITLSIEGQQVELAPQQSPQTSINEILIGLDETATSRGYRVVFFIDEFQQIGELSDGLCIEAAFRNAAQYAKNTTYIFSGSSRRLLARMFDDPDRPFYRMCDKITLVRIASKEYRAFLQNLAHMRWKKELSEKTLNFILELTRCDSYYINLLCDELWEMPTPPGIDEVNRQWLRCYQIENRLWLERISKIARNQLTLLKALAHFPTKAPTGTAFLRRTNEMSRGSAHQALRGIGKQ